MKKIFVTGDLHGEPLRHLAGKIDGIGKGDVLICLGDFGVFFGNGLAYKQLEQWMIDWFAARPFTTVFIDGNHENFDKLEDLPTARKFGGKVGKVNDKLFHLRRGEIYTIFGQKIFAFGGAVSIDKNQRVVGVSWWPQELPTNKEYEHGMCNLDKHNWDVDIVITHTMPNECGDEFRRKYNLPNYKVNDPVSTYLSAIAECLTFKVWYCGHYHVNADLGIVRCLYTAVEEVTYERIERKPDTHNPYWDVDDDF